MKLSPFVLLAFATGSLAQLRVPPGAWGNTPADKRNEILDKINNERNDCNKASNPQKCFDCVDDAGLVYIAAAAACFLTIEAPWVTLACEGAAATVWNQAIGNCVRGN